MSLFKAYKVNTSKVMSGVEVEFPEAMNDDGTIPTFWIAYAGASNEKYKEMLNKHTRGIRDSNIKEDKARQLLARVYSESVILNWTNVLNEEGIEVSFSPKICYDLLVSLPEFFKVIQERANELTSYLNEDIESIAKN